MDLWHDSDVMPAAPIFLQLIADFVVYLGCSSGPEKRSPLRISFYVLVLHHYAIIMALLIPKEFELRVLPHQFADKGERRIAAIAFPYFDPIPAIRACLDHLRRHG